MNTARCLAPINGEPVRRVEDKEKGLLAIQVENKQVFRFGRMVYDDKRGYFRSNSCLALAYFVTFPTKNEAIAKAKSMGWPQKLVKKIGSRFWTCWGLACEQDENYFLANFS